LFAAWKGVTDERAQEERTITASRNNAIIFIEGWLWEAITAGSGNYCECGGISGTLI
jgi:hypothetical protein